MEMISPVAEGRTAELLLSAQATEILARAMLALRGNEGVGLVSDQKRLRLAGGRRADQVGSQAPLDDRGTGAACRRQPPLVHGAISPALRRQRLGISSNQPADIGARSLAASGIVGHRGGLCGRLCQSGEFFHGVSPAFWLRAEQLPARRTVLTSTHVQGGGPRQWRLAHRACCADAQTPELGEPSTRDQRFFAHPQRRLENQICSLVNGDELTGCDCDERDCVRPSAWGAASKAFFCATVFGLSMQIGPVHAQSGQTLPPVTVDAPKTASGTSRPSLREGPRGRSARRGRSRRLPGSSRWWNTAPVAAPARARQRSGRRLSRQPERYRHQDRHADSDDAAVDLGGDEGSDRGTGRPEPHRSAALHARRDAIRALAPTRSSTPFKLRGFDAPRYLDGLRLPADNTTFAMPRIETYGLERIEVLKGRPSGLYGQSDPGGLLNMVSKRPTATPQYEVCRHVRLVRALSGCVRYRRSDRQERRVSLSHRRPCARQQHADRLRPGQQAVHRTKPDLASDRPTPASRSCRSTQKIDNKGYQQYVPGQVSFLPNPNGRIPYSRYLGEPGA